MSSTQAFPFVGVPHLFPHTERAAQLAAEVLAAQGDRELVAHGTWELADALRGDLTPLQLGWVESHDMARRLLAA